MVHPRRLHIALGAFVSTLMLGAFVLLGGGLGSRPAPGAIPILASAPTSVTTAVPTTVTEPPTTSTASMTSATSTTVTTVAPTTLPPTTAAPAPRPPTTPPAPRPVPVTAKPRPVVTAAPRPAAPQPSPGSPSDFTTFGYRWNPCSAVTVSSTGPDVSGVVAELASITGLHLQMVASGGQISVGWGATPAGGEVGQTDWRSMGTWLDSAVVTVNPAGSRYMATLLRHELGHAVGLGHAAQSNEIMYGTVSAGSPTDYQAGDLAGLRSVGAAAGGC